MLSRHISPYVVSWWVRLCHVVCIILCHDVTWHAQKCFYAVPRHSMFLCHAMSYNVTSCRMSYHVICHDMPCLFCVVLWWQVKLWTVFCVVSFHILLWRNVTWRDLMWPYVTWRDVPYCDRSCRLFLLCGIVSYPVVLWCDVTWHGGGQYGKKNHSTIFLFAKSLSRFYHDF